MNPFRILLPATLLLLTGCASTSLPVRTVSSNAVGGHVVGGQQPVAGAAIQLYAVGTAGDGAASTPLLTRAITTDSTGAFQFHPADYSCAGVSQVYLTATGGNPGTQTANPNLSLLTALGPCSALTDSTYISINELTTVAGVFALSPYITGTAAVGSSPAHASALAAAFSLSSQFVDPTSGLSPGSNVPAGDSVPTTLINTLGDITASCINTTGGTAGDSSPCGQLFSLTTPSGQPAPTDTVGALIRIAQNPTLNTAALFALAPAAAPFQPTSSNQPPDFRVRLGTPASQQALQFSAAGLTFATTTTGTTSAAQPITITNSSQSAVTLSALTTTGANGADFAATSNCGASLAAGANCLAQVTVTPSATGTRTGYLSVNSNTPDSPQYLPLTATGQAGTPHVSFSASTLTFLTAGTTQDVTVTNTGTGTLTLSGIATHTPFYSQTNNCPASLAPSATCTVSVVDQVPGPRLITYQQDAHDILTIANNDPVSNPGVFLGTAVGGNTASYSSSSLVFPPTVSGSYKTLQITAFYTGTTSCGYIGGNGVNPFFNSSFTTNGKSQKTVSCTYSIDFGPQSVGPMSGKFPLDANGGYIPLYGVGVASLPANVTLTPSLTLSNGTPGNLTFSNLGSTALGIQGVTAASGFTQTNNCGTSLPAQSVCTITVTSVSTLTAPPEGLITVTHDQGTSSASVAAANDIVYDFGTALAGTTSQISYTVTAAALDNQNGESASITGGGDFLGGSCNLVRSQSCSATATFKPTATGTRAASGSFTEGASGNGMSYSATENVRYTGVGAPAGPLLTFSTPGFGFGSVGANTSHGLNLIVLYNSGSTTATVTGNPVISGANALDFFAYPSSSGSCDSLAPGKNCSLAVLFTPGALGLRTASLAVTDGNSGQSFSVPLAGAGSFPAPFFQGANQSFSPIPANTSASVTRYVTVYGNHPLNLAVTTGAAFYKINRTSCAQDETPCAFQITWTPPASNTFYQGVITATDPISGLSTVFGVGGTSSANATATVNPSSLTFASRAVGSTSIPQNVTLGNSGTDALALTAITLGGTNASEFSLTKTCGASLAANATCTLSVTFAPTTSGSKSASITVTGNATNLPLTIPITGSAQ